LRTPLNAVIGFTQLMRMAQAQGRPPRADYLGLVDDAARQLLALVEDVLQLRAVAAPRSALRPGRVALHSAVAEALELLAPLAAAKAVVVSNEVQTTLHATCDAAALRQALVNLCSNAIRFNRPAGAVRVSAEPLASGSEAIALHVQDAGDGLEAAELARLFQPFERLGKLPGVDAGSGLGLVIARALAQAMGGSLALSSERGVGTRATLVLPS
jgi:signal transduction histidine kinase